MTYRIRLLPRTVGHPFAKIHIYESPEVPRFEGGAVIVVEPVDIDDGPVKPPALFAWPLDMLGGVSVEQIEPDTA